MQLELRNFLIITEILFSRHARVLFVFLRFCDQNAVEETTSMVAQVQVQLFEHTSVKKKYPTEANQVST